MYLQKLAIQGFKSFANKSALEFTPGVTAIVGPNGSGKSNIADAVRWVLGEQSLKSLRGKKSGDVIFAGSDKKTRLGYCQVDMHLDNEDHKAPIDYSEIVISRKIYRDGEGEYFLNKHRVRLQDILMLLAKSNFGQRSYSIIGQGTVDLFLGATPAQRKEYFDEAAGVRQFQIKKEQAENKLSLTRENLHQAEILIQEIEPRLRSLTRQVRRLERREEVTRKLKEVQNRYYSGLWHELKNKHRQEEKNYQTIETASKVVSAELEKIQKQMQQLALGTTRQEEYDRLQRLYDSANHEKNNLLRDQAVLKGKIQAGREQAGDIDLVWLERKLEQLTHEQKNSDKEFAAIKESLKKFQNHLKNKENELHGKTEIFEKISHQLSEAKKLFSEQKLIALPEVAQEVSSIYTRQNALLEKIEAAETADQVRGIKSELKILTSELAKLSRKLGDGNLGDPTNIISLQDQLTEALHSKDILISEINEIKVTVKVNEERSSQYERRFSEIKAEIERVRADLSRNQSGKHGTDYENGLRRENEEITNKIKVSEEKLAEIRTSINSFNQAEQKKKEEVFALQNSFAKKQDELNATTAKLNSVKIELAKLETRLEDLEQEMVDELNDGERQAVFENRQPPAANPGLFSEIQKIKKHLELIGGIDPQVSEEYRSTKERYDFLTQQSEDLIKAMEDLEEAIGNLNETIKKQFDSAFEQINKQFTQYFKILFNGGNAGLTLVKEEIRENQEDQDEDSQSEDGDDAVEEEEEEKNKKSQTTAPGKIQKVVTGIDIHATPPGKKLRGISMLSGGERALTSIALICAIIHHNPSPFVVLDEVDAALDESNSIRFASIIDRLSKKTQFIIITHNRATMEQAHTLYGVTMGDDGVSKLLSINMEEAEKVIADR